MAKNIRDGAPNVVSIDTAKKTRGRKPKAAQPEGAEERAPAFGHNQPTAEDVRRWAHGCIALDVKIDEQKLVLKDLRGKKRDYRAEANGAGIILRELDEAIDELKTEQVDLLERQERLNFYRRALGLPVFVDGAKKAKAPPKTTAEDEETAWRKRGEQAALLGQPRTLPEGCPPDRIQAFLGGWDAEHENIMKKSPLTAGAFKEGAPLKDGTPTLEQDLLPAGAPETVDGVLILRENHFVAGTKLEHANTRTLLPEHRELIPPAETVKAVFGSLVRVIKERDAECEGGFYVDTGGKDVPVSDPEPFVPTAETLA